MKKINLKQGLFVYELGEQKMYETLDEVLKDYPDADTESVTFCLCQPYALGVVRADDWTETNQVFMQVQSGADDLEILED